MAEECYPHLVKEDGKPARLKRVPRTQVSMIVQDYLNHGWTPEEMCWQHPYLLPAEVYAAMCYFYDHQQEIHAELDAELREEEEAVKRIPASPFLQRLRRQGLR